MNAPFEARLTKAGFRRCIEATDRRERRFEWAEGRVAKMANVTKVHARLSTNFLRALSARLDLDTWSIVMVDLNVEQVTFIRVPEPIVAPLDDEDMALSTDKAVILVEVLSPSTVATEFVDKLAEHTTIASLDACIVASQDDAICWVWERRDDGTFPAKPSEVEGRDAKLVLRRRGFELPPRRAVSQDQGGVRHQHVAHPPLGLRIPSSPLNSTNLVIAAQRWSP